MYKCRICTNSFESVVNLNNHVKYSHPNQNQPVEVVEESVEDTSLLTTLEMNSILDAVEYIGDATNPVSTDTPSVEFEGGNSDGGGANSDF